MTHSDDNGLVLPPKIAPIQVVIIPVWATDEEKILVIAKSEEVSKHLSLSGLRIKIDYREGRPGPKFFEWEKKGVPARIEIGPRDVASNSVVIARRDNGTKETVVSSEIVKHVNDLLDNIQTKLYDRALQFRKANSRNVDTWEEFQQVIEKEGGFLMSHWCGSSECEENIKEATKATARCIPFDQEKEDGKCIYCGEKSDTRIIFAKAY